ncbi:LLM class flavin-dependent oxidoreductase [Frankia sp. CNm7]|uniref:LLM class flavin-dependent oxidoreductase n=1 Tax=Frankia nepalensis TaxID=1836974 RepID=A0A937RJ38_9ACTN|nr:LLM class flavin-dependent oxidoreductase [Frankia nepalensis]MBL7499837.1 LLM class flavin-dependent oxidoreductase [Frankia nepalensis]MBL7516214.1 LLM class flavin-dependent oxidoreductase [Frankia nepalensis]MBL7519798.1 LLM class flavin-dependent oxidoreductase [Frankia nepalensis]MBL7631265.1 LLM class flavin-dependent oxidoreductase [Frankia nepalensis]
MTAAPEFGPAIPETAAPEVEFISLSHLNPSTELNPIPSRGIDLKYFRRYVRSLEEGGYDYTLLPYGSNSADSFVVASAVGQLTERLRPIVALRPNTTFPTVGAQKLATLDQLTEGRAVVHLISGGSDAEQARQGDYLAKERRYARTSEYIDVLRRSWTEPGPFSHDGEFYKFDEFGPGFAPYEAPIPISIGGQSAEAFQVGGEKADIFSFWGEPLDDLRSEIERVNAIARAAGRATRPRIWVTFRPIIAQTDRLAWEKARDYVAKVAATFERAAYHAQQYRGTTPQNVGSQRALAFADRSELYDRALWTKTAAVTNAAGASTALVGSPETVAAAILDYVDRGASLVSIRGYDTLADAVDYGRYVLPLVREELAHRAATGRRGTLQATHLGNYGADYAQHATAGQP